MGQFCDFFKKQLEQLGDNWHNFLVVLHGIMESVESNNFYNLGTTLTTGHLAKLHLAVSQSLLAQELMGAHGIKQLSQPIDNWHNFLVVLHGIMESLESNNFYRLGTTLTTGHLTKLHLAVSQSLLAQELFWLSVESNNWHNWETTGTTFW